MSLTRTLLVTLSILSVAVSAIAQTTTTPQTKSNEQLARQRLESCPAEITQLAIDIAGKTPEQTYTIIEKKLGKPDGDMGSGVHIPYWNCYSGKLVYHEGLGPSFTNAKGVRSWLITTHNLAERTILSKFEMYSPLSRGNSFWIGNLDLNADHHYVYTPADKNDERLFSGKRNFFQEHPAGTFKITYRKGVKKDQMLESLADQTILCDIAFTSSDGKAKMTYPLASSSQSRNLSFRNCQNQFEMLLGWPIRWK